MCHQACSLLLKVIARLLGENAGDDNEEDSITAHQAAAVLMFEVAWADHDIDDGEMQSMLDLLRQLFNLILNEVNELIDTAEKLHDASVGLHQFTALLNDQLSAQEKYEVIAALWTLANVDDRITALEEHTIRRVSELLYVPHRDFIRARIEARQASL